MKIKELSLINFKRFTNLQIKNIPLSAKLVLLIGANGSGKSSIFDGFEWFVKDDYDVFRSETNPIDSLIQRAGRVNRKRLHLDKEFEEQKESLGDSAYYIKDVNKPIVVDIQFDKIGHHSKAIPAQSIPIRKELPKNIFFGRPSMRIVPRLVNDNFNEKAIQTNSDGPTHFIDFDTRFQSDVKKFTWDVNKALRDPLFLGDATVDLRAIAQQFINPVNTSLARIFGTDPTTSIRIANYQEAGNTLEEPPKLIFSKGSSLINYDLLSHGEKQIIVILLNFIIRSSYFQDTVYYIDEMDVHLNTTLQYALLKEITENWIPENCQLWTASHSLGFIEYAKDTDHSVILDFDNFDFDKPQTIEPLPKYLDDIFEVAIPRHSIAKILGNKKIVLCENKNYELYSLMGLTDFVFTDVQNANSVYLKIKRDKTLIGLRDRDFLTDNEIKALTTKFPNYKILRYYCFENYLYHPENIAQIDLDNFDKDVYKNEITMIKNMHRHNLVTKIAGVHKGYEEFKAGGIKEDNDIGYLAKCLESDDFETFYPFLSFKDYYGSLVHKYKMDKKNVKEKLVQTDWFTSKIIDILK